MSPNAAPRFSRYDRDPEAIKWARAKVEDVIAKYEGFEKKAREQGTTDPKQWREMANMLRMEFVGGEGCVIARFDRRLPTMAEAIEPTRPLPPG